MNQPYIALSNLNNSFASIEWHTSIYDGTPIWEAALEPPGGPGETGAVLGSTYDPGGAPGTIALTSPAAVPEPSTLYLLGFGAVCVYIMGHKRKGRKTATTNA